MQTHVPTLLVAASAGLVLVSAAAASIGVQQRLRRGVWWWISANVSLAAGLALHALGDREALFTPLAALLSLQWPIVTLTGVRRFFSRGGGAVPAWADWVVLVLVTVGTGWTWLAPFDWASAAQVFAAASLVVTLHAALAVSRLEDFATAPVLKSLVFGLVCSAVLQGAWLGLAVTALVPAVAGADVALGALFVPAAAALLMPQLSLVMNHERNVAQQRAAYRKLRQLAEVDTLTRLPNRRHFHELAARTIKSAPELATLIVFDIDRLKHINDVLGHTIGDEALRQVGTALRETLRRRDVAGRLGGDEFAVVLPRTKVADIGAIVARVNARLDDRQVAPRIARVTLNVGATQMQAGEPLADALRRAEVALETARDQARQQTSAAASATPPTIMAIADSPPPFRVSAGMPLLPVGEVLAGKTTS
jgi:diguanylate cyclase (GGDEF)-like protein